MSDKVNLHDLQVTTNFPSLKCFNFKTFDLQEVIFFQWLVVYGRSGEWFHTAAEIEEETGIKVKKLKQIEKRFEQDLGILHTATKGKLNKKYYLLELDAVANKTFLAEIYRAELVDIDSLEERYKALARAQKQAIGSKPDLKKRASVPAHIRTAAERVAEQLKSIYTERRKYIRESDSVKWVPVMNTLQITPKDIESIIAALQYGFDEESIQRAFFVFCDQVNFFHAGVSEKHSHNMVLTSAPKSRFVPYFLSKKGGYDLIQRLLHAHSRYGHEK